MDKEGSVLMYKVVIFSGGTGSAALQEGIAQIYGSERILVDIVINAYDNGKSTGECRKAFDYKILGPSDMRKNQLIQFKLIYSSELKDEASIQSKMLKLFTMRISAVSCQEYYQKSKKSIEAVGLDIENRNYLKFLLDYFFFENVEQKVYREKVKHLCYKNFSLANIFYASCAACHGNSLSYAGYRMSKILGISNNVSLISHLPLKLNGKTKNGLVVENEATIVTWHNFEDPIQEVFLCDNFNEKYIPIIDEGIPEGSRRVTEIIKDADIIIFSSGTQWSSLIPTYLHRGFREAIQNAKAIKYLVMNNKEDDDMSGLDSEEICKILNRYIDLSDIKIILNDNAPDSLQKRCEGYQYIHAALSDVGSKKHDAKKLVNFIFDNFFGEKLSLKHLISDFDGTLWNNKGDKAQIEIGVENLKCFSGMIVSGNSYKYLKEILSEHCTEHEDFIVFCDYGNTVFHLKSLESYSMLTDEYFVDVDLAETLKRLPGIRDKVHLRGNVVITVKPLLDRIKFLEQIQPILEYYHGDYVAKIAGSTSVDVCRVGYHKAVMLEKIMEMYHLKKEEVIYIGNELDTGNDEEIASMGISVLPVRDIYECNVFLKTRQNFID